MSTGWLNGINRKLMYKTLVGASTLYWAIWLSWNDMVFNNTRVVTPMNVIFHWTHWICFRALLQKEDERPHIIRGCRVLETSLMEIFASNGWSFTNKIAFTWCLTLFQRPLYLFFGTYVFVIRTYVCIVLCRGWNIEIYSLKKSWGWQLMRLLDTEIRWELSNTTSTYMPLRGCSCLPLPIFAKRTL
jgi:hypothetical protein